MNTEILSVVNELKHNFNVLNIKLEQVEEQVKKEVKNGEVKKEDKKVLTTRMMNFKKDEAISLNRKFYQKGFESFKREIYLLLKTRVSTTEKLIAKKEKEVENLEKLKVKYEAMKGYVRDMELYENMK